MSIHGGSIPKSCETFDKFFQGWLARQQAFLDQLIDDNSNPHDKGQLVEKVLSHYEEYYEEKSKVREKDIFQLFSPPWLTSFEKAFLWVGGFKPSLIFTIAELSVLSYVVPEQVDRLESLKVGTRLEERKLEDAFAAVQENMGSPTVMELTRRVEKLVDGQVSEFQEEMENVKNSLGKVVEEADNLRRATVMKLVHILSLAQKVKFLAAVAKYQLGVRAWGLQNDQKRE